MDLQIGVSTQSPTPISFLLSVEKDQDLMLPVGGAGKGKPRTTNPFNRSVQRSDIWQTLVKY